MTIPLQKGIIYGPVQSRRLGRSLGINLLPTTLKICTLNCVYCQYGWTHSRGQQRSLKEAWPSVPQVLSELAEGMRKLVSPPAFITFSGNGEPTLHPQFAEIVDGVIKIRDKFASNSKTVVLSNSTTLDNVSVVEALQKLDLIIMKLDCGTERCFRRYNRPLARIRLCDIISMLQKMEAVIIQSLFSGGPGGNSHESNMDNWIKNVEFISPLEVQIYTLDRGYPSRKIKPLPLERLHEIKNRLGNIGIFSRVY